MNSNASRGCLAPRGITIMSELAIATGSSSALLEGNGAAPQLIFGLCIAGGWLLPGRKRLIPYSIQWLKRVRPALFRQDLNALLELLARQKIKPLIAQRLPLVEARRAHEMLGNGGVTGKVVLVCNGLLDGAA